MRYELRNIIPCTMAWLLFLPMHLGRDFQAQAVQADEAGGVVLIIGLGRVGFHRGIHLFIQTAVVNLSHRPALGRLQCHHQTDDRR